MSEWTDIGEQLKETREKKELSLADVSHQIRVPASTLEALEENDYSGFPSPTYAKSFLAQYSEFLDIDADDWLDCFETGNVLTHSENLDYLVQDEPEAPRAAPRQRSSRPPKRESMASGRNFTQPLLIFLVTAGFIAAGVWGFMKLEDQIAETDPELVEEKKEPSKPLLPEKTVDPEPPIDSPIAVRVTPNIDPITGNPIAATPEEAIPVPAEEVKPPPRAIIVNEDEE